MRFSLPVHMYTWFVFLYWLFYTGTGVFWCSTLLLSTHRTLYKGNPHAYRFISLRPVMPSKFFKQPQRTKKYYKGRALIFMENKHNKQYRHVRRKSIAYQTARFYKFGGEYSFVRHFIAHANTIEQWNETYQDTLHARHGVLLILIKDYMTDTGAETFKPEEISAFYPHLSQLFGYWVSSHRSFQVVFNDITAFQFIKPRGHSYYATTRLRAFCVMFDQNTKKLFTKPDNA